MPEYCYKCSNKKCSNTGILTKSMDDGDCIIGKPCGCGGVAIRDYAAESVNVGIKEYATPLESHSLGIHADQIPEHNRRFPDVEVTSDGCPVFHNTKQHSDYLKKIGWDKQSKRKVQ